MDLSYAQFNGYMSWLNDEPERMKKAKIEQENQQVKNDVKSRTDVRKIYRG